MRKYAPVSFPDVRLEGDFWRERLDTVLARTIPSQHKKLGEYGILDSLKLPQPPPPLRFPRNEGMRIDFILGSQAFADRVVDASIHREERKGDGPSDHVPVVVDLDLGLSDDDDRPMIF